ncbi:hypothetical protein [Leisingera sp. ANG-Vp]|uniref:hypothetical protein n=1 Tax=Leisingera sp. ANG-Vp TaxID=1577896 RepID=UPI001269C36C|nr:hypothetical protein [Leisingera sp. ANG-Vp]
MTDDVRDILKVTSGGLEACDPNQYDRFLFYGLISQPYPRQSDIDYSVAVREAALKDRGSRSPAVKLAGQLRTVTGKPVDVAAAPFKVPVPGVPAAQWSCPHQAETAYLQGALFDGLDASLIAQPDSTVIEGTRSTFPEYAKGSKRLQIDAESEPEQHPSGEVTHMNAQYGQIWLEHYLPMAVS